MSLSGFLERERDGLPDLPGVYVFRDLEGRSLYVGKAKSIRKRVLSHVGGHTTHTSPEIVEMVQDVEFIVTGTEAEALLLEQRLVRRDRPRFNIKLRDDKSYPFIGVSVDEEYPRVYFTRERLRSDRIYFGPFSSAGRVRHTLDLLGKLFQYRTCQGPEPGRSSGSPCLDYHIGRCRAPCVGNISRDEYAESIAEITAFLSGRYGEVEGHLETAMEDAAARREYEQATLFRDRLRAVRSLMERKRIASPGTASMDAVAVAQDGSDAAVHVLQVRDGLLVDRLGFYLENAAGADTATLMEQFLMQFYTQPASIPARIALAGDTPSDPSVARALALRRGGRVAVGRGERGDRRRIVELAERNARLGLAQNKIRRRRRRQQRIESLEELMDLLNLESVPVRIEGFDISNLGAEHTVASMVVLEGGVPKKADYRRFTVGREAKPDDFASMEEVLSRRAARYIEEAEKSPYDRSRDESFASLPGLIVIDGGVGQLGRGLSAAHELSARGVRIVSLAKRLEELHVPERRSPIRLGSDSPALQLLQRVRDEAHRFAVDHHRVRRGVHTTSSILDRLDGIGPKRKQALLRRFGSADRVLSAGREDLEAVPGLPGKVARRIHEQLHRSE